MARIIPLFSLLNDDFKIGNGKVLPVLYGSIGSMSDFNNPKTPFFMIFTDENE